MQLIEALSENLPTIIEAIMNGIVTLMEALSENLPTIIEGVVNGLM